MRGESFMMKKKFGSFTKRWVICTSAIRRTSIRSCAAMTATQSLPPSTTQSFLIDRNFDGKFDEADADVHYDLNFAVLVSQESYSCGNLFPSMFRDMGLMVLGERSKGGACTILSLNTADGFYYHISDYQMRLTNDNWEVIDGGIEPDVKLVKTDADGNKDYSDFYDLALLSNLINEYYAK